MQANHGCQGFFPLFQVVTRTVRARTQKKYLMFDDVIGNVRASGGIGDLTHLADDCMRGAVDV